MPVSAMDWVDPAVAPLSSVKVSEAVREPRAVGVNFTLQVQLAAAATLTGAGSPVAQLVPAATMEKSDAFVPVIATAVMCNTSVPVLLSVPFSAALEVLTSWLPKAPVPAGVATGAMPVPESVTGVGFAMPVTVMVMLALRALAAAGSNVTLNVQLAAGATWPLTDVRASCRRGSKRKFGSVCSCNRDAGNAQRSAAIVRNRHALRRAGGVHALIAEADRTGRQCRGRWRNAGAGQVDCLRRRARVIGECQRRCKWIGRCGSERQIHYASIPSRHG